MKDYRVTVKVRNNRILKAIEDSGGAPGAKWCQENGLSYGAVNMLINMTESPITSYGELRQVAQRLCDVTNKLPEDLWSNQQLYPLEKNFSEMEMDNHQIESLIHNNDQPFGVYTALYDSDVDHPAIIDQEQTSELINIALEALTPMQTKVIRMRFFDDLTLEEIADQIGVSKERVRQIEQKALRRLRKPKNAGLLMDCDDLYVGDDEYRAELSKAAEKSRMKWALRLISSKARHD